MTAKLFLVKVAAPQIPICNALTATKIQFDDKKLADGGDAWKLIGDVEVRGNLFVFKFSVRSDYDIGQMLRIASAEVPPNGFKGIGKVVGIKEADDASEELLEVTT